MESLSVYTLKMNVYEMNRNPDYLIKDLIEEYHPEDAIMVVFSKYGFVFNDRATYTDSFNYFYDLASQIKKISGFEYSEDDLVIYALYVTPLSPLDYHSRDMILEVIKQLERVFGLHPSGDNEKFASEAVKYKLLHLYSEQINNGKYEDMKALLKSLNETKDEYEKSKNKIITRFK